MKLHEIDFLTNTRKKECPTDMSGSVLLRRRQVHTLEEYDIPEVLTMANMDCAYNQLFDLKGGPKIVDGNYSANANYINCLDGFPEMVGKLFQLESNLLTNLKGIHKIVKYVGHRITLYNNPIESHILGLVLIGGLQAVEYDSGPIQTIFNKYLAKNVDGDRYANMLACQQELIEAGYEKLARL